MSDMGGQAYWLSSNADYIQKANGRFMVFYYDSNYVFTRMRYNIKAPKDTAYMIRGNQPSQLVTRAQASAQKN